MTDKATEDNDFKRKRVSFSNVIRFKEYIPKSDNSSNSTDHSNELQHYENVSQTDNPGSASSDRHQVQNDFRKNVNESIKNYNETQLFHCSIEIDDSKDNVLDKFNMTSVNMNTTIDEATVSSENSNLVKKIFSLTNVQNINENVTTYFENEPVEMTEVHYYTQNRMPTTNDNTDILSDEDMVIVENTKNLNTNLVFEDNGKYSLSFLQPTNSIYQKNYDLLVAKSIPTLKETSIRSLTVKDDEISISNDSRVNITNFNFDNPNIQSFATSTRVIEPCLVQKLLRPSLNSVIIDQDLEVSNILKDCKNIEIKDNEYQADFEMGPILLNNDAPNSISFNLNEKVNNLKSGNENVYHSFSNNINEKLVMDNNKDIHEGFNSAPEKVSFQANNISFNSSIISSHLANKDIVQTFEDLIPATNYNLKENIEPNKSSITRDDYSIDINNCTMQSVSKVNNIEKSNNFDITNSKIHDFNEMSIMHESQMQTFDNLSLKQYDSFLNTDSRMANKFVFNNDATVNNGKLTQNTIEVQKTINAKPVNRYSNLDENKQFVDSKLATSFLNKDNDNMSTSNNINYIPKQINDMSTEYSKKRISTKTNNLPSDKISFKQYEKIVSISHSVNQITEQSQVSTIEPKYPLSWHSYFSYLIPINQILCTSLYLYNQHFLIYFPMDSEDYNLRINKLTSAISLEKKVQQMVHSLPANKISAYLRSNDDASNPIQINQSSLHLGLCSHDHNLLIQRDFIIDDHRQLWRQLNDLFEWRLIIVNENGRRIWFSFRNDTIYFIFKFSPTQTDQLTSQPLEIKSCKIKLDNQELLKPIDIYFQTRILLNKSQNWLQNQVKNSSDISQALTDFSNLVITSRYFKRSLLKNQYNKKKPNECLLLYYYEDESLLLIALDNVCGTITLKTALKLTEASSWTITCDLKSEVTLASCQRLCQRLNQLSFCPRTYLDNVFLTIKNHQ